jgi:outer membrane receptor protein involved in Fe transport
LLILKLCATASALATEQGSRNPDVLADGGVGDAGEQAASGPPAPGAPTLAAANASASLHFPSYQTTVSTSPDGFAASAETITSRDLQLLLIRTPEDVLRAVPGLFIAQHQGGGKADQLFLRGFDADHGTDVAFFFDEVPVNEPSHGHGQGYTDLNFMIPETIDRLDVSKGPYYAQYGDFDTAGAVSIHTRRAFAENELLGTYGSYETYRVLGIGALNTDSTNGWLAADIAGTNGPFVNPEGLQRYNVFAKEGLQLSDSTRLEMLASAYGTQWSASGAIPLRAVESGEIPEFGAIDPTEGGQTQKQMFILTVKNKNHDQGAEMTAYLVRYELRLFNNFTFYLRDPVNGDEIEQNDQRFTTGVVASYHKTFQFNGSDFTTTLGAAGRYDSVDTSLYHVVKRVRLPDCFGTPDYCYSVNVGESDLSAWLQEDIRWSPLLRTVLGVRADLFEFNTTDQAPVPPVPPAQPTTGVVQSSIVNPKLTVVISPTPSWDIYLNGGGGFHSNDARAAIASDGAGALPRAWGAEIGSRVDVDNRLDLAAALWFLYLESEFVFDQDTGGTFANGPTRRYGLDLTGRWNIYKRWVWADFDLSLAHATYVANYGNGNAVALAPTETLTAGISMLLPNGLKGRLSVRQIADRPATEDGSLTATGYTVFDLTAGYRWRFLEVLLSIQNLFNATWREAQFATVSRIPSDPSSAGQNDINFTPGAPLNLTATAIVYF